jgi:uncharacterized DUF497 family protein
MEFEWDYDKDRVNRKKHGISFDEAKHIFDGPVLTRIDDREDYGEIREISMGSLLGHVVIVVVHTDRAGKTRIISARKANRKERQVYYDSI